MTQTVESQWAAGFVPAARLLARLWSRPEPAEVEAWRAALAEVELDGVEELAAALDASDPDALLDEHEALLVGPGRVPCAPYESLWRDDVKRREQGTLMGPAATDVVRIYRDLGLAVRDDAHELPDHVAVEWEALAHALEAGEPQAAAELARGHLAVWMPAFCAAVEAEAETPFYAALARLTPSWTAALSA